MSPSVLRLVMWSVLRSVLRSEPEFRRKLKRPQRQGYDENMWTICYARAPKNFAHNSSYEHPSLGPTEIVCHNWHKCMVLAPLVQMVGKVLDCTTEELHLAAQLG